MPDGYAVRFHSDAFESVARFVANERKCCPFVNYELSIARESGPLWLRITGPTGTREVLQAELGLAGSDCAAPCAVGEGRRDRAHHEQPARGRNERGRRAACIGLS